MLKFYAVGSFETSDAMINFALLGDTRIIGLFEDCDDLSFFADEQAACQFQRSKDSSGSFFCGLGKTWKILFEVQFIPNSEGPYIAKLIKASLKATQVHEITLEHSLTPIAFLNSDQYKSLNILPEEEMNQFVSFLKVNKGRLPIDVNQIIFSYFKQLCFFKLPEEKSILSSISECTIS